MKILNAVNTDPHQLSLKTQPAQNYNFYTGRNRKTLRFPNITNKANFLFDSNNLTCWLLTFPAIILGFLTLILAYTGCFFGFTL